MSRRVQHTLRKDKIMGKHGLKPWLAAAVVCIAAAVPLPAAAADLILGTGGVKSAYFNLGNKLVRAIALGVDGPTVNLQATKGDADNLKLLAKKRRGIQLGLVRLDTAKMAWNAEGKKQNRKVLGLFSLGSGKDGKPVVLLASKKVDAADAKAIVGYLLSAKGMKRMKKLHPAWSAASGSAAFKAAGIPVHPGAVAALKDLGMM